MLRSRQTELYHSRNGFVNFVVVVGCGLCPWDAENDPIPRCACVLVETGVNAQKTVSTCPGKDQFIFLYISFVPHPSGSLSNTTGEGKLTISFEFLLCSKSLHTLLKTAPRPLTLSCQITSCSHMCPSKIQKVRLCHWKVAHGHTHSNVSGCWF